VSTYQTILGVGAALMDLLAHVDEEFLASSGAAKGGMTLVDSAAQEALLRRLETRAAEAPGGSACNTLVGLARLGRSARFLGRRGSDAVGDRLESALASNGLDLALVRGSEATGAVLSCVTPDAQRTMFTSLGAAAAFTPAEIDESAFDGVGLLYLEGYLLFNAPVFDALLAIASRRNIPVALDCGSFEVVGIFRDRLNELLGQNAFAIFLANEDESRALTGTDPEPSLEWIAQHVETVAVKLGARGALLAQGSRRAVVPAAPVSRIVDTTGAGDLWASGFLSGLDQGLDLNASGHLAASVAAEAIQVLGAQIPEDGWRRLGISS
jgi:sugar/nucleoside kinase (ribokinase family)